VLHSEYNDEPGRHHAFLQIWIEPDVTGIAPSYEQKHFAPEEKRGRLRLIARPTGARARSASTRTRCSTRDCSMAQSAPRSSSLPAAKATFTCRGTVQVNGHALRAGDALKQTPAGSRSSAARAPRCWCSTASDRA